MGLGSKAEEESIASHRRGERLSLAQGWRTSRWRHHRLAQPARLTRGARFEAATLAGRGPSCGGVLECGVPVGGASRSAGSLKNIVSELKLSQGTLTLDKATITEVKTVGLGHCVCVDITR